MRAHPVVLILIGLMASLSFSQSDIEALTKSDTAFCSVAEKDGQRTAFLSSVSDDAIVFRPAPIVAKKYWTEQDDKPITLKRNVNFVDLASTGRLGYTTGNWQSTEKREGKVIEHFGEFVTLWERREGQPDFKIVLDMQTKHDDIPSAVVFTNRLGTPDVNTRGWSATNDAMRFLRTGLIGGGLASAYKSTSMEDVRLLIDDEPPIAGKKNVINAAKRFTAVGFPENLAIYQSGDMAYFWNQCRYQNSREGLERGNCLQIMKLRNKKWWIVLGVFARLDDDKPPVLLSRGGKQ